MRISDEALAEFKAIYKAEKGVDLSDSEAYEHALNLLLVMKVFCKPLPKDHKCPACENRPDLYGRTEEKAA